MKPARIVFPGFTFGKDDLRSAAELARRGVGGFCLHKATAAQACEFVNTVRAASPYNHPLVCADIEEDLSEVITDAPVLISNQTVGQAADAETAYRKGLALARQARSLGIDWLLCPVVDLGYSSPAFSENPATVTRLAGDFVAGVANGGALNCIKYFPGVSGILKTLAQMEDAEFMPYKSLFRRADAIMISDMVFENIDNERQAFLSEKIVKNLLKKRLNYKGCVVGKPMCASPLRSEAAAAIKMILCGVEILLAPKDPNAVIDAVEREFARGTIEDEVIHSISNHELFISKVENAAPTLSVQEAFSQKV